MKNRFLRLIYEINECGFIETIKWNLGFIPE